MKTFIISIVTIVVLFSLLIGCAAIYAEEIGNYAWDDRSDVEQTINSNK
jgi:hypothetical protein